MSAELGQKTSHLYFYYPLTESQHLSSPHATGAVTFPTTFLPTEIISMFMSQYACCKYYISKYHLCSQPLWNCSRFWICHRTCYLVHYGVKLLLYHNIFKIYSDICISIRVVSLAILNLSFNLLSWRAWNIHKSKWHAEAHIPITPFSPGPFPLLRCLQWTQTLCNFICEYFSLYFWNRRYSSSSIIIIPCLHWRKPTRP